MINYNKIKGNRKDWVDNIYITLDECGVEHSVPTNKTVKELLKHDLDNLKVSFVDRINKHRCKMEYPNTQEAMLKHLLLEFYEVEEELAWGEFRLQLVEEVCDMLVLTVGLCEEEGLDFEMILNNKMQTKENTKAWFKNNEQYTNGRMIAKAYKKMVENPSDKEFISVKTIEDIKKGWI